MPDVLTLDRPATTTAPTLTTQKLRFSTSMNDLLQDLSYNKYCKVSYRLLCGLTHANFGDYISFRDGMLTYTPKGKIAELEEHGREWKKKDRQSGKPAKVARAVLLPSALSDLTDKDFETFANHIKATDPKNVGTIELVQGRDIRFWYHGQNNDMNAFASCMQYDRCQRWFGIYEENSACHLLVVHKDGKAVGRVLVWDTDKGRVVDRMYGSTAARQVMQDYADDQGWKHVGRNEGETYVVQLEKTFFKAYPYIDSFQYVNHAKKTLTNRALRGTFDQSLGYADGGPHANFTCLRCNGGFDEDELTIHDEIGALCRDCAEHITCRYCGTVSRMMPDGGCDACVEARTCECGNVDQNVLEDHGDGPLCSTCNALGHDGVAAKRFARSEAIRIERERIEEARRERERQYELRIKREAEERRLEIEARNAYQAENARYAPLVEQNRRGVLELIQTGPAVLYEQFHYQTDGWVRNLFLEHPAEDFAALSKADLRRLIRNVQIVGNQAINDPAVPYGVRRFACYGATRAYLTQELARIATCTDRIKVTEVTR